MTVYIQLTTAGTNTGPFNLFSNLDGYTTAFETGVAKSALVAGYTSALVPDGTTTIRVQSVGACTNYIDIVIGAVTTTTSTTTLSPTECGDFSLEGGLDGRTFNFTNCEGLPQTVVVPAGDAVSYCIELPYFAAGATYIGSCGGSILSFNYVGGNPGEGTNGTFQFSLSNPLPSNINITGASIEGFDEFCSQALGSSNQVGTATIIAGNTLASASGNSTLCSNTYQRQNSIVVNGFTLVDGDTINIGGVTVTISISTTCQNLFCFY